MQGERPHCQIRRVDKVGVATPLIVPSLSSCGFPQVADIYDDMKDRLYGVCLVSALDLESGCIPVDVTDEVNLVLIDSGMYEARNSSCVPGDYCPSATSGLWLRQQYLEIAKGIDRGANVILVNYDTAETLQQQIMRAAEDFAHAPQAASDFLVKPELPSGLVNVGKLAKHAGELQQFDIVGITAREAGDSLVKRCSTVVRTIAKSGGTAIEAGDGLDGAEGAAFGSQGHGHPGGEPSVQAQGVQPGVHQGGEYLAQPRTPQRVDVLIPTAVLHVMQAVLNTPVLAEQFKQFLWSTAPGTQAGQQVPALPANLPSGYIHPLLLHHGPLPHPGKPQFIPDVAGQQVIGPDPPPLDHTRFFSRVSACGSPSSSGANPSVSAASTVGWFPLTRTR